MRSKPIRFLALVAAACAVIPPAAAEGLRPAGYFVQGGVADYRVWNASAGVVWPWAWKAPLLGTEVGGLTEGYIARWSSRTHDGRHGFIQLGLVPVFRFGFDKGRSPWFAEAGVGISTMNRRFETTGKQFTTSFNFVDVAGLGRSFGTGGERELSVRLHHVSNAGIRVPNPGQNFLQLRYASRF